MQEKNQKEEYTTSNMQLPILIGHTPSLAPVHIDLATAPHLLVGGMVCSEKSNFLKHVITSLLASGTCDLSLIDIGNWDFLEFTDAKSVRLVGDVKCATAHLQRMIEKMQHLKEVFSTQKVTNITQYNSLKDITPLKREVIIIEEYAYFSTHKDFQEKLTTIARTGHKFGIHIVLSTERPHVVRAQLRDNISTTICFRVRDSRTAKMWEAVGAEKITFEERGSCMLVSSGKSQKIPLLLHVK